MFGEREFKEEEFNLKRTDIIFIYVLHIIIFYLQDMMCKQFGGTI